MSKGQKYTMDVNSTKGLGWKQRFMLDWIRKRDDFQGGIRHYYVGDSREQRRVARSLSRRGLIRILGVATSCWKIRLETTNAAS